jgi:hypothetical protein
MSQDHPEIKQHMKKVPVWMDAIEQIADRGPEKLRPDAARLLKLLE